MRGDELEFVTGLQLDGWVREPRRAVFFCQAEQLQVVSIFETW